MACRYLSEISEVIRAHRAVCVKCGPRKVVEMPVRDELKEAA